MEQPKKKLENFGIATESKLYCLNISCANNIGHCCNLKGVTVGIDGVCAGVVKVKIIKKVNN